MPPTLQSTTRDSSVASTRWTVVRQAADSQTASQHALSALAELCQIYWRPVYVLLRLLWTYITPVAVHVTLNSVAFLLLPKAGALRIHWARWFFPRSFSSRVSRFTARCAVWPSPTNTERWWPVTDLNERD